MKKQDGSGKFGELSATKKQIIEMMSEDGTITIPDMAASLGLTERAVEKNIKQLREAGLVERKDGDRGGRWVIISQITL
ncbi:MAG: winged helix-turn-helix domain-containing protein [Methanomassiliicoccaceae archaeon]|nr:winged helix-turn-helix domain-containing protein [Methanomassiliicoccaceae archaeon]